jgi:hypothetical protein
MAAHFEKREGLAAIRTVKPMRPEFRCEGCRKLPIEVCVKKLAGLFAVHL